MTSVIVHVRQFLFLISHTQFQHQALHYICDKCKYRSKFHCYIIVHKSKIHKKLYMNVPFENLMGCGYGLFPQKSLATTYTRCTNLI